MYQKLMVGMDNSNWSQLALQRAIELSKVFTAQLVGVHVYAAAMHGLRFRQMESGLPDRYSEKDVQRQRSIHDVLIGRGLELISRSYLQAFEKCCKAENLQHESRLIEGRNWERLLHASSTCDMTVIGAHGLGHVARATLGSVCERLVRLASGDVLVVREATPLADREILVALDGSSFSKAAFARALVLARAFSAKIVAVAAYDPFFHGVAFKGLTRVLSKTAARLFRFREQEQLHDEVINAGLAQVYRKHLDDAQTQASQCGVALATNLLNGKAFDAIAAFAEIHRPALLVVGRHGLHYQSGLSLGGTAENLLRSARCDVLVVSTGHYAPA